MDHCRCHELAQNIVVHRRTRISCHYRYLLARRACQARLRQPASLPHGLEPLGHPPSASSSPSRSLGRGRVLQPARLVHRARQLFAQASSCGGSHAASRHAQRASSKRICGRSSEPTGSSSAVHSAGPGQWPANRVLRRTQQWLQTSHLLPPASPYTVLVAIQSAPSSSLPACSPNGLRAPCSSACFRSLKNGPSSCSCWFCSSFCSG